MISTKSVFIMAVVGSFVAGSFVASPELHTCAAANWTSEDIADETIQSVDIKNAEVKTADIAAGSVTRGKLANGAVDSAKISDGTITELDLAADSVGASEMTGVSKLVFTECTNSHSGNIAPGENIIFGCTVPESFPGDRALATISTGENFHSTCFAITRTFVANQAVSLALRNVCTTNAAPGTMEFSILLYKIS